MGKLAVYRKRSLKARVKINCESNSHLEYAQLSGEHIDLFETPLVLHNTIQCLFIDTGSMFSVIKLQLIFLSTAYLWRE
jgi:hypothetical protein